MTRYRHCPGCFGMLEPFAEKCDICLRDSIQKHIVSSTSDAGEIVDLCDEKKPEAVNHPSHYNQGKFEVIDVIEDWNLGFNDGNAVKYIARARHKGQHLEDLEKARWYIEREIQRLKVE